MGLFGRSADLFNMPNFEYKHLSHHFKFTSQQSKMNDTPASGERVQKYVFNFEIYRFAKKRPNYPILPYAIGTLMSMLIGLFHARHCLPDGILKTIVTALIISQIRYCYTVYGNGSKKTSTDLTKIFNPLVPSKNRFFCNG